MTEREKLGLSEQVAPSPHRAEQLVKYLSLGGTLRRYQPLSQDNLSR